MDFVTGFLFGSSITLPLLFYWRDHYKRLKDTEQWLRDEINAHDKTRHALREAAARMRRENRERVLGLIEGQRVE